MTTEPISLTIWLAAFFSMVALDVCWVFYLKAAGSNNHPIRASLAAAGLHGFTSIATLAYTGDARYITATMLGTVLGTYAMVKYNAIKEAKQ